MKIGKAIRIIANTTESIDDIFSDAISKVSCQNQEKSLTL